MQLYSQTITALRPGIASTRLHAKPGIDAGILSIRACRYRANARAFGSHP
jgi:hypothetical protein